MRTWQNRLAWNVPIAIMAGLVAGFGTSNYFVAAAIGFSISAANIIGFIEGQRYP